MIKSLNYLEKDLIPDAQFPRKLRPFLDSISKKIVIDQTVHFKNTVLTAGNFHTMYFDNIQPPIFSLTPSRFYCLNLIKKNNS